MSEIEQLKTQLAQVRTERDAALAKCAEMRGAIQFCNCGYLGGEHHPVCEDQRSIKIAHALSSDCGKGWHSPQEWDALQAKCERMRHWLESWAHNHEHDATEKPCMICSTWDEVEQLLKGVIK